jgi:DNA repair protein RecO (recombination protein O)
MPIVSTEAFVIGSTNFNESDKIVHFYTKDEGKISAVGKYARKSKRRFGSSLELLDHLNITYFKKEGKELYSLSSADIIKSIACSEPDLKKIAFISFVVELIREFSPAGETNNDIYNLLCWIHQLSLDKPDYMTLLVVFILKLLLFSGLAPRVDQCTSCDEEISDKEYYFSTEKSGLICSKCYQNKDCEKPINLGLVKFMDKVNRSSYKMIERMKLSDKGANYLFNILESYVQTILQKKLKTTEFLKESIMDRGE